MKRMKAAVLLTAMMGTLCVPTVGWADETEDHEPITIMDANRDYTQLIELVHEKYPEINIEIIPYKGRNATAYMKNSWKQELCQIFIVQRRYGVVNCRRSI